MTGKFLVQAIFHADNPSPKLRKLLLRCNLSSASCSFARRLPFLDPVWRLLPVAFQREDSTRDPSRTFQPQSSPTVGTCLHWLHLRIGFAPLALRLLHVLGYVTLAALTYFINRFLTTAIGDLAV